MAAQDEVQFKEFREKVVVSGISGRFPRSANMNEFSHNLYNKVDMIDDEENRWKHFSDSVPRRSGKIGNLNKFDASFFAILNRLANNTDPQARILLEHSYEAILDAGVSPQSIIGSRTGVFVGCSLNDSLELYLNKIPTKDGHSLTGSANFYLANRISYALGLCGPSVTIDTACSSSACALDIAYKNIQDGTCDAALVGGTHLVLNILSTNEYNKIKVLAPDGVSRPFDKKASGFSRGEAICVIFLQKQQNSKRVYARLLEIKCNNDGFKPEGSTFPSRVLQQKLFEECYASLNMSPHKIGYVEAHATSTYIGDAEEVAGIDGAFCKDRKTPLLIGSLKSNMGHAEASAGVSAIAKLILILENQKIPPNINLDEVRDDIPAFSEGRIKVVRDVEKFENPFVALNSFGLGGSNVHAVFKGNDKPKINSGIPTDSLNRLVCWSGRTEAAIESIFDDITTRPLDAEHIALLQNTQIKTTLSNIYRGYGIFAHDPLTQKAVCVERKINHFNGVKKPIVWVYSGMGSQWLGMGEDLMKIPAFAKTINFCHQVLLTKGLNLKDIITTKDEKIFDNVLHSYVGIIAIEIALTDMMKSMGLEPDYIIGHSVGELGCSYCDGCFTAEETILVAHARGISSINSNSIAGAMAAVGMGHEDVKKILPEDIDVACHNAADSTTISGPAASVKSFVQQLTNDNIFAREVACSGVALHSRYIKGMGENLNKMLGEVIKVPKKRSAKWLSSTYPADKWSLEESQYSSAGYHTTNLLSPVLFQEVVEQLPECLTIEIAPHGLLKPILKRSMKGSSHFNLTQRGEKDGVSLFLNTLGEIFQNAVDFDIAKLYPEVEFPVSRGTPMISPMIKWDHSQDLFVPKFYPMEWFDKRNVIINISDKEYNFVQGHIIDGKILFPGTGLVALVWESFALMHSMRQEHCAVTFDDVKFLRATSLAKNKDVIFTISIHKVSGEFEISEGQSIVASGKIRMNDEEKLIEVSAPVRAGSFTIDEADFYKEMRLRGYHHKDQFRAITESRDDGCEGKIKWENNWTTFTDCLLQFQVLMADTRMLILPTKFRKMVIDPIEHKKIVSNSPDQLINVVTCPYSKIIRAGGVEIHEFQGYPINRRRPPVDPVLETYKFIPHTPVTPQMSNIDLSKFCIQLLLENMQTSKVVSVEVDACDGKEPLSESMLLGVTDLPMITSDINFLTERETELPAVKINAREFGSFGDVHIIIKSQCLDDSDFIEKAKKQLHPRGFILSRQTKSATLPTSIPDGFQHLATISTESEFIIVVQCKSEAFVKPDKVIRITQNFDGWLEPLKEAVKDQSVLIYSQNDELSGILGLFNCLRKEAGSSLICVYIDDHKAPPFDIDLPFYQEQLAKGLATNVLRNGQWGTYRHLKIQEKIETKQRHDHCYVKNLIKGDMSSLNWVQGNLSYDECKNDARVLKIQYGSLNFRDVMLASGKLNLSHFSRINQQCLLGYEFAGVMNTGKRVMGIGIKEGFSTFFKNVQCVMNDVPDNWTLEEAATVPLVYSTVLCAFLIMSKIEKGQSVLIHAGSGGVGIAALHIAFHYGLEVFTTVSTQEKKDFLLKEFPMLKSENIGNSRDISFEQMIQVNTEGRGVDYVLNSLSQDKLLASIRCLANYGTFLEIGKFDILNKTKIDLGFLEKNIVIRSVVLETRLQVETVRVLMQDHIDRGIVKPLKTTVFDAADVEKAFRFLASGKHIGKVLLKVYENENDLLSLPITVKNQIWFDKSLSYILVGGMGGFGLELADWLVLRGCQKLVMSSSRGLSNGYQAVRIKTWQSYGVEVLVNTSDITTKQGCEELLQAAIEMGPVGGIFNLAVALRDGIFENQTAQMFKESLAPKAEATKLLDELSRKLCPQLEHFVIFSSVSCGRGNPGQSNYGLGNSIMERIVEQRQAQNLPAKAIQWGAVGDVGLLADLQEKNENMTISGSLPQSITSCIEVLDLLLTSDQAIVASMVVAEKKLVEFQKDNVIEALFNILGIQDKKSISMDSPLSKLGLDSLMTVEITQLLEREFSVFLTMKELQTMTLYDLEQRTKGIDTPTGGNRHKHNVVLDLLLTNFMNETKTNGPIVCLNKGSSDESRKILVIPGIEGAVGDEWITLAKQLDHDTFGLQVNHFSEAITIQQMQDALIGDVINLFKNTHSFTLIAHSLGCLFALNIAKALEKMGKAGVLIMIDGSPLFFRHFSEAITPVSVPREYIQNEILRSLINLDYAQTSDEIYKTALVGTHFEEKLESFIKFSNSDKRSNKKYSKTSIEALINRLWMTAELQLESFPVLESIKMSLIVPTEKIFEGLPEDYDLSHYSSHKVPTTTINGNHLSIVNSPELSEFIKKINN